MSKEFYTYVDLAKRYGVARLTIRRWVEKGILPPPRMLGDTTKRWPASVIAEWEASLPVATPEQIAQEEG